MARPCAQLWQHVTWPRVVAREHVHAPVKVPSLQCIEHLGHSYTVVTGMPCTECLLKHGLRLTRHHSLQHTVHLLIILRGRSMPHL